MLNGVTIYIVVGSRLENLFLSCFCFIVFAFFLAFPGS